MKKILIFKSDRIGDFINISSVIKNIKFNFPNSELVVFCSKYNSKIASYYKEIDEILIYENNIILFLLKFYKIIFSDKFDLILQLDGKKNSYLYASLIRSKLKACISYIKIRNFLGLKHKSIRPNMLYKLFFRHIVDCLEDYDHPNNSSYHYLSLYYKLLNKLDIKIKNKKHYLPFIPDKNILFENYILIHIDERWDFFNQMFLKNFSKKIYELNQNYNLIFTSNYEGNNYFNELKIKFSDTKNVKFIDKSSINELLNIIYHCKIVISSHTGFVVHAGSAFNKKIIDVINAKIDKELDRWIPFDINYQRIYFNKLSDLNI